MGGYDKHSNGNGSNGHSPTVNGHRAVPKAAAAVVAAANGEGRKRVRFEVVDAPEK